MSITTFSSQRPSLSARIRSAGRASSGATPANNCFTSRVLLPLACVTSSCRCGVQRRRRSRRRRCPGPRSPRLRRRHRAARQQLWCRGCRAGVRGGGRRALQEIEGVLQLRRRAQGERAVLQPLAGPGGIGAQAHGLDTAPGGTFAVAQFVHRVVEQAGEAEAQVEVARLDLAQVVEDGELQRLLVQDEGPGVRQQHLVGEPGEGGGEAGGGRGSHGVNVSLAERCPVSVSPGTGTGKGAGRRWRGADGPGGRAGMLEGSEGPERAAGGRHEQRQTRQVLSAFFSHFFAESCTAAATWQQRIGGDRR